MDHTCDISDFRKSGARNHCFNSILLQSNRYLKHYGERIGKKWEHNLIRRDRFKELNEAAAAPSIGYSGEGRTDFFHFKDERLNHLNFKLFRQYLQFVFFTKFSGTAAV